MNALVLTRQVDGTRQVAARITLNAAGHAVIESSDQGLVRFLKTREAGGRTIPLTNGRAYLAAIAALCRGQGLLAEPQ